MRSRRQGNNLGETEHAEQNGADVLREPQETQAEPEEDEFDDANIDTGKARDDQAGTKSSLHRATSE